MANFQTHKIKASYRPTAHSNGDTEIATIGDTKVEAQLPNNAVVVEQYYHVAKAMTAASGTPKIAIGIAGQTVVPATDYNNSAFAARTTAGLGTSKLSTTAVTKIEITASGGAGDITGGQIDFYIEYITTDEA